MSDEIKITPARRRALEIMADGKEHGGQMFGYRMWPQHSTYGRPLKAQGAGYAAGCFLAKLAKTGLIEQVFGAASYFSAYRITAKGRAALNR